MQLEPSSNDIDIDSPLAATLRPLLGSLSRKIISAIGAEVDEYARPLEGEFGRVLSSGVERALERFLDELAGQARSSRPDRARSLYVALGRGEMRAGRTLDALLAAYRIGARVAWERFAAAAEAAGHEPRAVYRLAGRIFTYIDAISAESVEGYTREQAEAMDDRARRRRALARLLLRPDATQAELREAATRAGWTPPAALAVLVLAAEAEPERVAARLDPAALAFSSDDMGPVVLVPDPDAPGRAEALARALAGQPAVLGPPVAVDRAALSHARAVALAMLVEQGRVAAAAPVRAGHHTLELLLHADGVLGAELASEELAPLAELGEGPRARAVETLRAWVDHPGQIQRIGQVLEVHPQTVRYRLRALRELFGERLDDPQARFRLSIALRVRAIGLKA